MLATRSEADGRLLKMRRMQKCDISCCSLSTKAHKECVVQKDADFSSGNADQPFSISEYVA